MLKQQDHEFKASIGHMEDLVSKKQIVLYSETKIRN
jgi:hypothetical protein